MSSNEDSSPLKAKKEEKIKKEYNIWEDTTELTEGDVKESEKEMEDYANIEQTKSVWEPEDARINRWVLRTDEPDVDSQDLLRRVGLPLSTPIASIDASTWTSFQAVAESVSEVFKDESWKRENLSDKEAENLFWNPPFVLIRNISKIGAVAAAPFISLYWSARLIYEQTLEEGAPMKPSALVLLGYPYFVHSYDYAPDDRGIAFIPTIDGPSS